MMLTRTQSMCVVHVLNGQTGFPFNNSQKSVSESLCFCSVLGFNHCSSLMLSLSVHRSREKKKSILRSFYLSILEEICLSFDATGFAVYMVFLFFSALLLQLFFTPLLLLLCFSPRFNDDVILVFDSSTFAFPSSNLYPKAVSQHLHSENNYRSSVPFFPPTPPCGSAPLRWLRPPH